MNLYIDCEFNGYRGELLSMALVADNGKEWYVELHRGTCFDLWVTQHVIPLLDGDPISQKDAQLSLYQFLTSFGGTEDLNVIADWPDDIKFFCEMLLTGPGTSIAPPRITMEIRRHLSGISEKPHHALHDARGIRTAAQKDNARLLALAKQHVDIQV